MKLYTTISIFMISLKTFALVKASNYATIFDAIPQLSNFTSASSRYNPEYGGRNVTHCCLIAVNESFSIRNGNLSLNTPNFLNITTNLSNFETALETGQFPCGATYNGDQTGAPAITVNYDWCFENCSGWEISVPSNLRQWIGPLVGFILPSLVFCLSIPRRRKLYIPDSLFSPSPGKTWPLIKTPIRATGAAIVVSLDTLVWLCICFASAGPMILSGIYEAFLDGRILEILRKTIAPRSSGAPGTWTADMRAKLLLVILVGAFDIKSYETSHSEPSRTKENTATPTINVSNTTNEDNATAAAESGINMAALQSVQPTPTTHNGGRVSWSVPDHARPSSSMMGGAIIDDIYPDGLRVPDGQASATVSNTVASRREILTESLTTWLKVEKMIMDLLSDPYDACEKKKVKLRQDADVEKQRFDQLYKSKRIHAGTGNESQEDRARMMAQLDQEENEEKQMVRDGLIYKLAEEDENYKKDQDKWKEAIGKVQTWLRTMLASQSSFGSSIGAPVVFFTGAFVYSIVDTLSRLGDEDTSLGLAFGMWWMTIPHVSIITGLLLGSNNPNTLEGIVGDKVTLESPFLGAFALAYPSAYKTEWMWFRGRSKRQWLETVINTNDDSKTDLHKLRNKTTFGLKIWSRIIGSSISLICIPFALAFLTSFYTPRVGISCRSLTFLVYAILQVFQIFLWVWVFTCTKMDNEGDLHGPTKLTLKSWTDPKGKIHHPRLLDKLICCVWWALTIVFGISSVFTAIGGTMMQLMGVYRNCLCSIPIQYWHNPHTPGAYINLSTNTSEEIRNTRTYWKGTGYAAIGFLCFACYLGWWYQRRLRFRFRFIVENLEGCVRTDSTASEKETKKKALKEKARDKKGKSKRDVTPSSSS